MRGLEEQAALFVRYVVISFVCNSLILKYSIIIQLGL